MRGVFALSASLVAGIAGVLANQDGDSSIVPLALVLVAAFAPDRWFGWTASTLGGRVDDEPT